MSTSFPSKEISSTNYNANFADLLSRKLPNEHSTLRGSELSKLFAESRNATERLTQFRVLHKKDSLNRKSTECRAAPVQSGSQLIESSLKSLRGKKENDNHNRQKRIFRTAPHSDPGATVTANIHVKFIISILSSVRRRGNFLLPLGSRGWNAKVDSRPTPVDDHTERRTNVLTIINCRKMPWTTRNCLKTSPCRCGPPRLAKEKKWCHPPFARTLSTIICRLLLTIVLFMTRSHFWWILSTRGLCVQWNYHCENFNWKRAFGGGWSEGLHDVSLHDNFHSWKVQKFWEARSFSKAD